MTEAILPGATLGVLGGGQLGRMFAIAARRMGYRVHVLAPDDDTPTGQVADVEIRAAYDNVEALERFARGVSVVTFEFENVPSVAAETAARFAPVRPGGHVLHIAQNRAREKQYLADAGLPVTPFASIETEEELTAAAVKLGCPAVLKTAAWGYDGKGQVRVSDDAEAMQAWDSIGRTPAIWESFIEFDRELSVVAARGVDGDIVTYGPMTNVHENHILDVTVAPSEVPSAVQAEAFRIARAVMESLDVVGVLCVEFFLTPTGNLMINEIAPRPHNSGHLTIDANTTCQFEQQVRAVCGLPLGDPEAHGPAAMANLLGDLWQTGEPNWHALCEFPDVKLHLYGKGEARPGRKMGHITALADTVGQARSRVLNARRALATVVNR